MEDYLIKEIDRIGELLLKVAHKLGVFQGEVSQYSISDIKVEMDRVNLSLDVDSILKNDNPLVYLVESEKLSDPALETLVEIIIHSDIDKSKKDQLLDDTNKYFDSKGYYSFKLHSLEII